MSEFQVADEIAPDFDPVSRKWVNQPQIGPCWRNAQRVWNLSADSTQGQLFCTYHQAYINPNGFACKLCTERQWPTQERIRATCERLHADGKDTDAGNILVSAVENHDLTTAEAEAIAHDVGLA